MGLLWPRTSCWKSCPIEDHAVGHIVTNSAWDLLFHGEREESWLRAVHCLEREPKSSARQSHCHLGASVQDYAVRRLNAEQHIKRLILMLSILLLLVEGNGEGYIFSCASLRVRCFG